MKAIRHINKQEKKLMDGEIRKRCVEICNQYELDYDTMMIYILHFGYGFGLKRILEFHKTLVKERNELKEWYGADKSQEDSDIHFFAMRQKLKDKGIDVEAIRDEVMRDV
jgi:hypothetical protein